MLQRFGSSLGYVFFAAMINSLGETATAAHTIANTVESAFYIPGYGMMTAAATLTGNAIGGRDQRRLRDQAGVILAAEVTMMLLSGALLRMVACSEPFYGVSIVIEGMLQGAGETRVPFLFNIYGMWGVRIVGTFICTQRLGLGLVSAWGCMIGHNLLVFAMYVFYYNKGRWNPLS